MIEDIYPFRAIEFITHHLLIPVDESVMIS